MYKLQVGILPRSQIGANIWVEAIGGQSISGRAHVYKWEGATLKSVNQASANLENPLEKGSSTHPPYVVAHQSTQRQLGKPIRKGLKYHPADRMQVSVQKSGRGENSLQLIEEGGHTFRKCHQESNIRCDPIWVIQELPSNISTIAQPLLLASKTLGDPGIV